MIFRVSFLFLFWFYHSINWKKEVYCLVKKNTIFFPLSVISPMLGVKWKYLCWCYYIRIREIQQAFVLRGSHVNFRNTNRSTVNKRKWIFIKVSDLYIFWFKFGIFFCLKEGRLCACRRRQTAVNSFVLTLIHGGSANIHRKHFRKKYKKKR